MISHARKHSLDMPFKTRAKRAARARACEWPGCEDEAQHRAARGPRDMGSHVWYCTEHLREHNAKWNFFEGMSDAEVEACVRHDTVWQRPTWKMGS
ncbi:MAG: hypothetical protein HQL36_12860, partial [Alphaproteobacteria bacterium]|nr:hypothetical protein [Alphaproteobacteria bacterium]